MKAFITGGTGFIGSHLIETLLNEGFEIYALARDFNKLKWIKGLDIKLLKGDLFNIPELPLDLDYVFHLAGSTKSWDLASYYTVNQLGTASLFQSLADQRIYPKKVIYLSSISASGPSWGKKPVEEDDIAKPVTHYGRSKLLGEKEVLKFKKSIPVVVIRASAIFGPRDTDFLHYFKYIQKGILLSFGSNQIIISLCYVKDLVKSLLLSAQKNIQSGEIINIAYSHPYDWDDIGIAAGKAMNKKLKRLQVPRYAYYLAALISDINMRISKKSSIINLEKYKELKQQAWIVNTDKAKKMLPFVPQYSFQKAINETIDWYLNYQWL
ncbi:MAG: NAD-dependent epimerase/dehydratase family protein [Candidatus Aminicenantaceae bacterium]